MLSDQALTISTLLSVFRNGVVLTWVIILGETILLALIPLFSGFAIDSLLGGDTSELWWLAGIMAILIVLSVIRRIYDTRIYGTIRVEIGKEQIARSANLPISTLNAQLGMGRELVDFLENILPETMAAIVQLLVSFLILFAFSPTLALAAVAAAFGMFLIYMMFHSRFYRLNGQLNQQIEKQVSILEQRGPRPMRLHLMRLRRTEVRISDAEALLYGLIFVILLGLIVFNLWFATTLPTLSTGTIFSIVSYSWEFAESALVLPITLQSWSRLSEIMSRLNSSSTENDPLSSA